MNETFIACDCYECEGATEPRWRLAIAYAPYDAPDYTFYDNRVWGCHRAASLQASGIEGSDDDLPGEERCRVQVVPVNWTLDMARRQELVWGSEEFLW